MPSTTLKLVNLNQDNASKKSVFLAKSLKIKVMITFLIEMLELPSFGNMNTSIEFETHDKTLLMTSWTEIMTSKSLFQNTFILRKPCVANFTDIIKLI